jgi:ubiquinone/menaquinone biosynthesis C-methylase UbiE
LSSHGEPIHRRIVDLTALAPGGTVLDAGCGTGPTLAAFAHRDPSAALIGLDYSAAALTEAATLLGGHAGTVHLVQADLRDPIDLPEGCVDVAVSYNVVEALPDPSAFLAEIARVLRPGGRLVLAHVDFDSIIATGPDMALDRQIIHAYADLSEPWIGAHSDGRIGRKLPGLISDSPLARDSVEILTSTGTALAGHASNRVEHIRAGLHSAVRKNRTAVTQGDIDAWHSAVQGAARDGHFFFAEAAVIVVAHRPAELAARAKLGPT